MRRKSYKLYRVTGASRYIMFKEVIMKRKLLSVFLSLAMVLTMMPVFAMADTSVGGVTRVPTAAVA